jgi:hypothetical protein
MEDYIKTSDTPYAAYLMLFDYTLIGCVDPEDESGKYEFYLTHSDPETRDRIHIHSSELRDKLYSEDIKFISFFKHYRMLIRKTHSPLRLSELEK